MVSLFFKGRGSRWTGTDSETDGGRTKLTKEETRLNFYKGITRQILEEAKDGMRLRCVIEDFFPAPDVQAQWAKESFDEAAANKLGLKLRSK